MNSRSVRFLCGALFLALGLVLTVAQQPSTIEVQFFDGNGVLETGLSVDVTLYDQLGNPAQRLSLAPEADGTYDVPATVGQKVSLRVYRGERTLGGVSEVQVRVPPLDGPLPVTVLGGPANDDCVNAIAVGPLPATVAGTTLGASGPDAVAGATCGTSVDANTPGVWYTVTGTGSLLTATTCPNLGGAADYDTKISVYCGDFGCSGPCEAQACVAGNDDSPGCPGFTSAVTWCAQLGVQYRIYVHGFLGDSGNFTLRVTDGGQQCTPTVGCLAAPPQGACCNCLPNAPFNCTFGTQAECEIVFGGEYQGDAGCGPFGCVVTAPGGFNYVSEFNPGLPIPANNPSGLTTSINVTDSFFVSDVNVDIGIQHTFISDLHITVTHVPTGIRQEIWTEQCGTTDNIRSTADDEGTTLTCAAIGSGPIDSVFWPPAVAGLGPLSVFDGINGNGQWDFKVADIFAFDTGSIQQWSLHIQGGEPLCTGTTPDDDDDDTGCLGCEPGGNGKVVICHVPPGNPGGAHTIAVSPSALPAHCNSHGDSCGECNLETQNYQTITTTAPGSGESTTDRPGPQRQDHDRRNRVQNPPKR